MLPVVSARKNTSTKDDVGFPALTVTVLFTVVLPPTGRVAETELGETESASIEPAETHKAKAADVIDLTSFIVYFIGAWLWNWALESLPTGLQLGYY